MHQRACIPQLKRQAPAGCRRGWAGLGGSTALAAVNGGVKCHPVAHRVAKLTKQSSPDGQHHHFIPLAWVDHIDQHVHLNKSGADVTSHWEHGSQ